MDVKRQRGVVLLVALMVLLTGSAYFLVSETRQRSNNLDQRLRSMLAAKQALIAYAVNYADNYGHNVRGGTGRLPCPALSKFSRPAMYCRPNVIGYLPSVWTRDGKRMEIDYQEKFLDKDIWYAVAAEHRYNPAFNSLNSISNGDLLSVDLLQDIVAVLIDPGVANRFQDRGNGLNANIADYLEGENADADSQFTLSESNDLLLPIRRAELLPLMERRVLGFVKQWLTEYKSVHGYYPYAAALGGSGECDQTLLQGALATELGNCVQASMFDMPYPDIPASRNLRKTWFYRNGWPSLIYYVVDESCSPARGAIDCDGVNDPERLLKVDGKPVEVVLISAGEPIETIPANGMQVRTDSNAVNYLDSEGILSAVLDFNVPPLSVSSNDQLVFIDGL